MADWTRGSTYLHGSTCTTVFLFPPTASVCIVTNSRVFLMALYQADTHWSDISLMLPSLRTSLSDDSSGTLLNLSNPIILTSTSLDRLSFTETVPSFPPGRQPLLFILIDLQEETYMEDVSPITTVSHGERVTVSTPTIPRMRTLLEEKIVVDKWTVRV